MGGTYSDNKGKSYRLVPSGENFIAQVQGGSKTYIFYVQNLDECVEGMVKFPNFHDMITYTYENCKLSFGAEEWTQSACSQGKVIFTHILNSCQNVTRTQNV